jgi:hypothetical protein
MQRSVQVVHVSHAPAPLHVQVSHYAAVHWVVWSVYLTANAILTIATQKETVLHALIPHSVVQTIASLESVLTVLLPLTVPHPIV